MLYVCVRVSKKHNSHVASKVPSRSGRIFFSFFTHKRTNNTFIVRRHTHTRAYNEISPRGSRTHTTNTRRRPSTNMPYISKLLAQRFGIRCRSNKIILCAPNPAYRTRAFATIFICEKIMGIIFLSITSKTAMMWPWSRRSVGTQPRVWFDENQVERKIYIFAMDFMWRSPKHTSSE